MMNDELKAEDTGEPATGTPPSDSSNSSFIIHHSSFHRIRLGPPWQLTPADGGTRHARKFGRPRTLDATERLWLVCERVPGAGEVRVNGTLVASPDAPGPFVTDITPLLLPRNEVVFAVASDEPLGAVALELRPA